MANTLAVVQTNNIKQAEYWISRLLTMIKLESEEFLFSKYGKEIAIPKNQGTTTISMRRYNSLPIRDISTAPSEGDEAKEKLVEYFNNGVIYNYQALDAYIEHIVDNVPLSKYFDEDGILKSEKVEEEVKDTEIES